MKRDRRQHKITEETDREIEIIRRDRAEGMMRKDRRRVRGSSQGHRMEEKLDRSELPIGQNSRPRRKSRLTT